MAIYEINGERYEVSDNVQGQELEQTLMQLSQSAQPQPTQQPQDPIAQLQSVQDMPSSRIEAGFEPLRAVASGIIAEPMAGLAGMASLPFGLDTAVRNIERTRDALTFKPRTQQGQERLQSFAETMSPVSEFLQSGEELMGETGFRRFGPIGGAIGETIPTALSFIGSLGTAKGVQRTSANISQRLRTKQAKNMLKKSSPSVEGLKETAGRIYNELDNLGVTINPGRLDRLGQQLRIKADKEGFLPLNQPKVNAVLNAFDDLQSGPVTLTKMDSIRKAMRGAAKSVDPEEARMATVLIDDIDTFFDTLKGSDTLGNVKNVGPLYKDARQLWHRAKKGELIEDAIEQAKSQASGFENGLRIQFRQIVKNKNKRRGFTPEEIQLMKNVERGDFFSNTFKLLGKLGFTEGQRVNALMSVLGMAGGGTIGGVPGAIAVPVVGQASMRLAQALTNNKAKLASAVSRAGKDGLEIAKAYVDSVPKSARNTAELTELLLRTNADLRNLSKATGSNKKLFAESAAIATFLQSQKEQQENETSE